VDVELSTKYKKCKKSGNANSPLSSSCTNKSATMPHVGGASIYSILMV